MDISFNPAPKPQHGRNKPTARARGAISSSTRKALHERSQGICERCLKARAAHAAHLVRRWKLERTTINDLAHLCIPCHTNADTTAAGRTWLEQFQKHLISD